jgi:hypothetical protein
MSESEAHEAWVDAYTEACRKTVIGHLEHATRFGGSDVEFGRAKPSLQRVHVTVRHQLEVQSESEHVTGRRQPGSADVAIADQGLYDQTVAEQLRDEQARSETALGLVNAVQQTVFAAISKRTSVRTHPRGLYHTHKCSLCQGKGDLQCGNCEGTGSVRCHACGGTGWQQCYRCRGSGTIRETHYNANPGPGQPLSVNTSRACDSCYGGRITCGCRGGWVNCRPCDATGRVKCGQCAGHGCLTLITHTRTYTTPSFSASYPAGTPDYVMRAIAKHGVASLRTLGRIGLIRHNVLRNNVVDFFYDGSFAFCEMVLTIRDNASRWILFGSPAMIFDAGGALEALLRADADALNALLTGGARRVPTFPGRAAAAIRPFMQSEIHQQIADADASGATAPAIVEKLKGAVSELYVTECLSRLRRATGAALSWRYFDWSIAAAPLSIIVAMLLLARFWTPYSEAHPRSFYRVSDTFQVVTLAVIAASTSLIIMALARWMNGRWLRGIGGKSLERWATTKRLTLRWPVIAGFLAVSIIPVIPIQRQWPLWVDWQGRLYGTLQVKPSLRLGPSSAPERQVPIARRAVAALAPRAIEPTYDSSVANGPALELASATGATSLDLSQSASTPTSTSVEANGDGGFATRADVYPSGVAVDAHGNLYISENNMFDLDDTRVRRVGVDGIITTVAGTGTREFGGDKGPAKRALLTGPVAIAADSAGTIYILDAEGVQDCNGLRVRRVGSTGIITTVAGGAAGFRRSGEDPGCEIFSDRIAIAPDGTVYIADKADNRVLVLDPNGSLRVAAANVAGPLASNGRGIFVGVRNTMVMITSRGNATLVGDGTCGPRPGGTFGMCQSMHPIRAIAVDRNNLVYIADSARVYRFGGAKPQTIIVAGNGSEGFSGDGGAAVNATFRDIVGIAVDGNGNLYIADAENRRIRRVDANGIITSVVGNRPHNPPRPADP